MPWWSGCWQGEDSPSARRKNTKIRSLAHNDTDAHFTIQRNKRVSDSSNQNVLEESNNQASLSAGRSGKKCENEAMLNLQINKYEDAVSRMENEKLELQEQLKQCQNRYDDLQKRYRQVCDVKRSSVPHDTHHIPYKDRSMTSQHANKESKTFEIQRLNRIIATTNEENMTLQQELLQCRDEKEDLQKRLSEYIAYKVTDKNPDIVNLGDRNRPQKLADKFSDLYDNQWSDAFEYLNQSEKRPERDAIGNLCEFVEIVFEVCEEHAERQLSNIEKAMRKMIGTEEIPEYFVAHMKMYKEERKKNGVHVSPYIHTMVASHLNKHKYYIPDATITSFVNEATTLCWLMCVQDPPMTLDFDCKYGDKMDKKRFTLYTNTGKIVSHLVWPAVRVCKGGAVICKGVAQGYRKKSKLFMQSSSTRKNKMQEEDNAGQVSYVQENRDSSSSETMPNVDGKSPLGPRVHDNRISSINKTMTNAEENADQISHVHGNRYSRSMKMMPTPDDSSHLGSREQDTRMRSTRKTGTNTEYNANQVPYEKGNTISRTTKTTTFAKTNTDPGPSEQVNRVDVKGNSTVKVYDKAGNPVTFFQDGGSIVADLQQQDMQAVEYSLHARHLEKAPGTVNEEHLKMSTRSLSPRSITESTRNNSRRPASSIESSRNQHVLANNSVRKLRKKDVDGKQLVEHNESKQGWGMVNNSTDL